MAPSPQSDLTGVARRLKEAMARRGVGNPEVAAELGVHPTTVSKWRQGRQPVEGHRRPALVAFLGVSEGWLFRGEVTEASRASRVSEQAPVVLPRPLQILAAEYELEAMKAGADDEDLQYIRTALRSPEAMQLYRGGYSDELSADEQRVEMESLIEMLRLWLKERIRRRKAAQRRS